MLLQNLLLIALLGTSPVPLKQGFLFEIIGKSAKEAQVMLILGFFISISLREILREF
jgi:hypothetical protein